MGRPALNYIRTHFSIEAESLARLDKLVGPKGRAEFVRMALDQALETAEAAQQIKAKRGKPTE